jgi:hypothetical protein
MALDFNKTITNFLSYANGAFNPHLSGAVKIAFSARVFADTITANGDANFIFKTVIDTTRTGFGLRIDGTAGANVLGIQARSTSADTLIDINGTGAITAGVWSHVGALFDYPGDAITHVVNGVISGPTGVTFGATTYTTGSPSVPDRIGCNEQTPTADRQWDGRITEVGVWHLVSGDADFSAAEWDALNEGVSPLLIRTNRLVFWEPFVVRRTAPTDYISGLQGTISGTLNYDTGPGVYWPRRRASIIRAQQLSSLSLGASVVRRPVVSRFTTMTLGDSVVRRPTAQRQLSMTSGDSVARAASVQRQGNLVLSDAVVRTATVVRSFIKQVYLSTAVVRTASLLMTVARGVYLTVSVARQATVSRLTDLTRSTIAVWTATTDSLLATIATYRNVALSGMAGFVTSAKTRWQARSGIQRKKIRQWKPKGGPKWKP